MEVYANEQVLLWLNSRRKPKAKSKETPIPSDTADDNRFLINHP